jgi:hypothetical protein
MRELARKAGLPDELRLRSCSVSRYRVEKFHER